MVSGNAAAMLATTSRDEKPHCAGLDAPLGGEDAAGCLEIDRVTPPNNSYMADCFVYLQRRSHQALLV